jgi:hypothetical protein
MPAQNGALGSPPQVICLMRVRNALTATAFSEAKCIIFAAQGLLIAHDFSFDCGIRVELKI